MSAELPADLSPTDVATATWFPHRWGTVLWWLSLVAFLALAAAVSTGAAQSWDTSVVIAVVDRRTAGLTRVAVALAWIGLPAVVAVWAGLAAFALDLRFHSAWRCRARVLVALLLDVSLVYVVKHAVARPRPPSDLGLVATSTASFPSGHVTATTAATAMLLLCLSGLHCSARARATATIAGVLIVLAMAWSRVYLGVHYPSDVLAGTVLGIWIALTTAWLLDPLRRRRPS